MRFLLAGFADVVSLRVDEAREVTVLKDGNKDWMIGESLGGDETGNIGAPVTVGISHLNPPQELIFPSRALADLALMKIS